MQAYALLIIALALPPEVERMLASRSAALDVTWATEIVKPKPASAMTYRFRASPNGDRFFEIRGDEEGVTERSPEGAAESRHPRLYLINESGYWVTMESSPIVQFTPADNEYAFQRDFSDFQDARQMGLAVTPQ